ncbi:MAG: tRNA (adenosine(37)-N6)-dimethylallyltransferase MiaA [Bacteroidetes bacterium]|nr:tRNA (adenosine(37)-N6)-dimethylallyltransferase MiaA [Bacteroidota bacterium]
MSLPLIIQIAGPTAAGKTTLAIELAKWLGTEIVSFDSRQCYQELSIGVARPTVAELTAVKHHFIASHSVHQPIDAHAYALQAHAVVKSILERFPTVVMVGGTGLYWKAFHEGLDKIPEVESAIRNEVIVKYQQQGLGWLQAELRSLDPLFASSGEMKNPQRMMRALEVFRATGSSILTFRKKEATTPYYALCSLGLTRPRTQLIELIDQRVEQMFAQGLVDEVQSLLPYADLRPLQTVGYSEIFQFLQGHGTAIDAKEQIKINTRQYAKRQLTWFRRQDSMHWFEPDQLSAIRTRVKKAMD